jgi:hypothetical protein
MTDETELPEGEAEFLRVQSKKIEVIGILLDRKWPAGTPRPSEPLFVSNQEVIDAIQERNARHPDETTKKLSHRNPANFLKDFIRKPTCNSNWPATAKARRITARQVYGKSRVIKVIQ